MKTKWTSKVPDKEGWYWVKYRGKHGTVICPAEMYFFKNPWMKVIQTARNDIVTEGPTCIGLATLGERLDGMKFGPAIPFPA
jgi:hypothetical protein